MKKRGKQISIGLIILIVILALIIISFISCTIILFAETPITGNIALISIKGPITVEGSSSFGMKGTSSTNTIDFLKKADEAQMIKAVVLEINSPGGSAVASKEISDAVKRIKKPTYAVIREVGASGGYWIASACDKIIANEMSITGSIGVISSYLQFEGLLNRYNISYERLVSGKYKDTGSPFKELALDERQLLQNKINKIHSVFAQEVSENRNLSSNVLQIISSAEFFLGIEALELGLVDVLGDMHTAEEIIKSDLKLDKINFAKYEKPKGLIESLAGVFAYNSFYVGKGIGSMLFDMNNAENFNILT